MSNEIVVNRDELKVLIGYVYGLLDFIDVDDFEDKENRRYVVEGFDEYVKPMMREDFLSPFTFVNNNEVEVFKEQLEDGWDVDASNLSFKDAKELYEKVQERFDYESCGVYSNIVTDFVNEYKASNKLIDRDDVKEQNTVDDIIADAEDRSSVAENSDMDRDLDL